MIFEQAFELLMEHEGGFVDDANDPGGATRYGITEAVAREAGYRGDMRNLPLALAQLIYRDRYWAPVRADELPEALRFDVFDGAVNSGPKQSILWLQRAVQATDDGVFGLKTLLAVKLCDPAQAAARYNGHRLQFMADRKNWPAHGKGWARRIAKNLIRGGQ